MKNLLCCLGLLAGFATAATSATAQERRMALPAAARPVAWPSARPEGSAPAPARPAPAPARPGWQPGRVQCRTIDAADVAVGVIETVHLIRFLRAHPEALTTYPTAPAPYATRCWPAARPARPARPASRTQPAARFGVKAGLNLATITGSGDRSYKYRAGFAAGLTADLPFSDLLSFHPELLYSQKGAKYSGTQDVDGVLVGIDGTRRLHYLDLPLLLRVKTNGLFFEAGPQLGYLLGLKEDATATIPGLGTIPDSNTDLDGTRRLDVGYVVGLGYQLPQGLEFGLRYNGGFSDLQNPGGDPKLRNSVIQAQVGYAFGK